jgi:predicted TIM-barrel fold metal-dependent hydrolase
MVIDTHAHIYHEDETRYPMAEKPSRPPAGTGTLEHLRRNMAEAGVERAVIVQTFSAYGWDNRLLADTAREAAGWAVGVCNLDPAAQDTPPELERLAETANVKGFRLEPMRGAYPMFYQPGAVRIFDLALRMGLVVCAHVNGPRFLEQVASLLSRYPEVPVVLDHAAYPKASDGIDSETVRGVVGLARFANLHLKLTFTVTMSDAPYPCPDTHGIVRRLVDAYGAGRCAWGSDFPCEHWLKKASYREHLDLIREVLPLSEGEKTAILEEAPGRLWFR